jgi:hypothetical protein
MYLKRNLDLLVMDDLAVRYCTGYVGAGSIGTVRLPCFFQLVHLKSQADRTYKLLQLTWIACA